MKRSYIYLAFICLLFYGCGTEYAEEPDISNPKEVIITEELTVTAYSKTDHDIYLKWYPVTGAVSYEIIVNDLYVITENITKNPDLDYYWYKLTNLEADTEYKITVRALSKDLHAKLSYVTERTYKNFVDEVIQVRLDKYSSYFEGFTGFRRTSDRGGVILANVHKGISYKVLVKLNPAYEIEWICDIPNPGYEDYGFYGELLGLHEMKDGSYILTTDKYVVNVSASGNLRWKTQVAPDEAYFNSSVVLPDESILLCGYSGRDKGEYVLTGYYMAKVSSEGVLLWEKHIDTPDDTSKRRLLFKSLYHNGRLLCCSRSDNASVVEFDLEGNILNEHIYLDPDNNIVFFNEILPSSDGNYFLAGKVYYRSYIIKITGNGDVLWERRGEEFNSFNADIAACNVTAQNTLILLEYGYNRWRFGTEIDSEGNIGQCFAWHEDPTCIYYGKEEESGRILYVTMQGDLIFINPDGYTID